MTILAHEQTHQLHDMISVPEAYSPVWLGESIAHYYGLKALARGPLPSDAVAAVVDFFIDPSRPIEAGLLELDRRHQHGDPSAYPLFYMQGATFWSEVDRVLQETAPDSAGLDDLLPALLQVPNADTDLPAGFAALLTERGGEAVEELMDHYLFDRIEGDMPIAAHAQAESGFERQTLERDEGR